jgi:hypothetical protein
MPHWEHQVSNFASILNLTLRGAKLSNTKCQHQTDPSLQCSDKIELPIVGILPHTVLYFCGNLLHFR